MNFVLDLTIISHLIYFQFIIIMEFDDVSMYFARGASKSQREKKQDRAYETRL